MSTDVTQTGVGQSASVVIESAKFTNAGVGLLVQFSPGASLTCSVVMSGKGVLWNNHDWLNGMTASTNGNLEFLVGMVAISVTSWVSGSVTLSVGQPGRRVPG